METLNLLYYNHNKYYSNCLVAMPLAERLLFWRADKTGRTVLREVLSGMTGATTASPVFIAGI